MIWDYCIILYSNRRRNRYWLDYRAPCESEWYGLTISFWIHGGFCLPGLLARWNKSFPTFAWRGLFVFEKIFQISLIFSEKRVEYRVKGFKWKHFVNVFTNICKKRQIFDVKWGAIKNEFKQIVNIFQKPFFLALFCRNSEGVNFSASTYQP